MKKSNDLSKRSFVEPYKITTEVMYRNSLGKSKLVFEEFKKAQRPAEHVNKKGHNLLMAYFEWAKTVDFDVVVHIPPAVEYIISLPGCDVNHRDLSGRTMLHLAAHRLNCPVQVFEMLIDKGADVNAISNAYYSVLGLYLSRNTPHNPKIVKCLLKAGFDTSVLNKQQLELIKPYISNED